MEDLPTLMTITKLLATGPRPLPLLDGLNIHCLRLMELTQRTSAVMKVSERHFDRLDPVINVFRTFGKLNEVLVTAKVAIVPDDSFADSVHHQAVKSKAEMVIVPWSSNIAPASGAPSSLPPDEFIKQVMDQVECHIAVVVDTSLRMDEESSEPSLSRSISMSSSPTRTTFWTTPEIELIPVRQLQKSYHVFLPYFGGKDDRVAIMMVIQLLLCTNVKATVVRIKCDNTNGGVSIAEPLPAHIDSSKAIVPEPIESGKPPIASVSSAARSKVRFPENLLGPASAPVTSNEDSETMEDDTAVTALLDTVPTQLNARLKVETVSTSTPLQYAVKRAKREIDTTDSSYHLVIVGRGTKYPRTETLTAILRMDLKDMVRGGQSEMVGKNCLGDAAEAMLLGHVNGELLVVQTKLNQ